MTARWIGRPSINLASQHVPHPVKQEPEDKQFLRPSMFFSCYLLVLCLTSQAGSAFLTLLTTVPFTLPYLHSHLYIYLLQYPLFGFILSPYCFSSIISPGAVFLEVNSYPALYLFSCALLTLNFQTPTPL